MKYSYRGYTVEVLPGRCDEEAEVYYWNYYITDESDLLLEDDGDFSTPYEALEVARSRIDDNFLAALAYYGLIPDYAEDEDEDTEGVYQVFILCVEGWD